MTFEAFEAPYFCRETVLQYPRCRHMVDEDKLVSEEFSTKENTNYQKDMSVNGGVTSDVKW
jgi:hypothetical protein